MWLNITSPINTITFIIYISLLYYEVELQWFFIQIVLFVVFLVIPAFLMTLCTLHHCFGPFDDTMYIASLLWTIWLCCVLLKENKTNKKRSDSSSLIPDLHFLFFDYHKTIVASLSLIQDLCSSEHDIMIIGLGGGALPSYIHQVLPKVDEFIILCVVLVWVVGTK